MAATLGHIKAWFDNGKFRDATHMIMKCDVIDYEDYPLFVMKGEDPKEIAKADSGRTMECYSYNVPWETQAAEHRANHWEMY